MINLQIEVVQKDPLTGALVPTQQKFNLQSSTSTMKINPAALVAANPALGSKGIYGFHANIDCDKAVLHIEGFKHFSISAFLNREPTIALLHVSGCTDYFQLNNLTLRRLDIAESHALLVGCEITDLNVGISTVYQLQKEKKPVSALPPLKGDVRDSNVHQLRLFVPHSMLNVQRSTIDRLVVERDASRIDQLDVRENSSIERMILAGAIGKFKLRTSKVSDLEFYPETKLNELDMKGSYVYRAHNCLPETISTKSSDSWKLVMDYAQLENNASLYALAGYQYMRCERRRLGFFSKLANFFIELSCGYGFRPLYTVLLALAVCLFCGVGFWYLTNDWNAGIKIHNETGKLDSLETLGYSLYYSVITFTTVGYGDISPVGPIARALACFEALSGISLSALFIFALTKRYGGLR